MALVGTARPLVALAFIAAFSVAGCASQQELQFGTVDIEAADTRVDYEIELVGAPDDDVESVIEDSLLVYTLQDSGAPSLPHLRRRVETDVATVERILRSEGYYRNSVTQSINVPAVDAPAIDPPADGSGASKAAIRIQIEAGPRFTLASYDIKLTRSIAPLDAPGPETAEAPVGKPAVAAEIVASEARLIEWFKRNGRPYAERLDRRVVADMENSSLDVEVTFDPGPYAYFGGIRYEGAPYIDKAYIDSYRPWEPGEEFSRDQLATFQRKLSTTGVFSFVSVQESQEAREQAAAADEVDLPIIVTMEEAKPQSAGIGVRFSTDKGPAVRFSYEHRNLFGANEQLRSTLDAGLEEQKLQTTFRKPQYLRDGQDLVAGFTVGSEQDDAFDAVFTNLSLGLERRLTPHLRVGLGGEVELANIEDDEGDKETLLFGVPAFVTYDTSDSLLHPTHGVRARAGLTPTAGVFDSTDVAFLAFDSSVALYLPIDEERRYIFATRARFGSIVGEQVDGVPQTRRFYSGGGGSVRGYKFRFIGPLDEEEDPEGGTSVVEVGVELRARVTESIGIVPFFEAGLVEQRSIPLFDESVQMAAGLGFRYHTIAGPVRADFAVPVNPRDVDDSFQFYVSIGQAF